MRRYHSINSRIDISLEELAGLLGAETYEHVVNARFADDRQSITFYLSGEKDAVDSTK